MLLTRDAVLQASDLQHEDVPVPEWGGTVRVRMLTGLERDALASSLVGPDGKPDMADYRWRMLAATMVGEDGQRLFSADDVRALGSKSARALDRVFAVADRINQIGAPAVEAALGN